jgi:hypothetical protein|tara:strand:- start:858 stop:1205 length:348 start_codon:yes stop_codon:yes gene_type:complete
MKVFIYNNGLCDQKANAGGIKKFKSSEDVDSFLLTLCGAMNRLAHRQIRVFVTNDEVEQHEVDHKVIMGDNYGLDLRGHSIKEVDTLEVAASVSKKVSQYREAIGSRFQVDTGGN